MASGIPSAGTRVETIAQEAPAQPVSIRFGLRDRNLCRGLKIGGGTGQSGSG